MNHYSNPNTANNPTLIIYHITPIYVTITHQHKSTHRYDSIESVHNKQDSAVSAVNVMRKKMKLEQHYSAGPQSHSQQQFAYDAAQDGNVSSATLNSVNRFMKEQGQAHSHGQAQGQGSSMGGHHGGGHGGSGKIPVHKQSHSIQNFWLLVESGDIPKPDTNVLCEPLVSNGIKRVR